MCLKKGGGSINYKIVNRSKRPEEEVIKDLQQQVELLQEKNRELKDANRFSKQTFDSIRSVFFALDRNWQVIFWNSEVEKVTGIKRRDILGKNAWEVFPEMIDTDLYHLLQQVMQENMPLTIETNGNIRGIWTEVYAYPSPQGLTVFINDISERKQIEQEYKISSEQFQKAFDANPMSMVIISVKDGKLLKVNDMFGTVCNYTLEDINKDFTDKIFWLDLNERQAFFERVKKENTVKNYPVSVVTKSGEIKSVLMSGTSITWQGEEAVLVITNDISDLKRYEQELAQLDRLKLIGVTAAGIAHEIRNPLTTVKGFLRIFHERERYAEDRNNIDLMIEELDRANSIITEYLSLARNKPGNPEKQNLNISILKFLPLLEADAVKNDIYIKLDLEMIPELTYDQDELRQLILNLVQNGMDAMPSGGFITIRTYIENDQVILAIQDQGEGISAEVTDKIGIPFFTTKSTGTGLGLATCYNIAFRNQARMDFETSPAGTVFRVIFPLDGKEKINDLKYLLEPDFWST